MIDEGHMTREEADGVVNKNLITRALGIAPEVETDVQQQVLQDGDIYLLCSDGLTDLVTAEGIATCINESKTDINRTASALIELANANGGSDNVSVILVEVSAAR
jgi:protein phosphatase